MSSVGMPHTRSPPRPPPCAQTPQLRLLDSIDESLRHPVEDVQLSAKEALRAVLKNWFPVGVDGPSPRLQTRSGEGGGGRGLTVAINSQLAWSFASGPPGSFGDPAIDRTVMSLWMHWNIQHCVECSWTMTDVPSPVCLGFLREVKQAGPIGTHTAVGMNTSLCCVSLLHVTRL